MPPALDPNAPPPPGPPQAGSAPPNLDPNAAPAAAAPYWAKTWVKEDGSYDHAALEKAPDDIKALSRELANFKNQDDFLKSVRELRAMASRKGIVEPLPANATDAERKERSELIRRAVGAPDKPEGYGFKKPDDIPDWAWNAEFATSMATIAHKHGASPELMRDLMGGQVDFAKKAIIQQDAAVKAEDARQDKLIRDTAAREGLSYDQAAEFAKRAGLRFGIATDNPIMKHASVMMALARVGKLLGEDKLVTGDVSDFALSANMTPEAAQKAVVDIQTNKNNPDYAAYWNQGKVSAEDHQRAVDKAKRLSAVAYANRVQRAGR